MPQKIFQRIGLRRDNNLSDVGNSTDALNNLLDGLVTKPSPANYISEDLNPIRNIWNVNLDSDGYQQVISSATESTDSSGTSSAVSPPITYKNKLDKFRVFSGEPRLKGGNGPKASYYDSNQVDENTANIFSGSPFKIDYFWQDGEFTYTDKLDPASSDADGGIEWEGFFIPTQTGLHSFNISSANCFTFDFETESYHNTGSGTKYTEHQNIGIARTFAAEASSAGNTLTIDSPANTKYVAIGMSATEPGNHIQADAAVTDINKTTGVITFARPDGTNSITGSWNTDVTFKKVMGQSTNTSHQTYVLKETERYSIRFRYFIPRSVSSTSADKNINFDFTHPSSGLGDLRFTYLYDPAYDFTNAAKGEFATYLDTSVLFGGGIIGLTDAGATPASKADYVKLKSTKKIDIKYKPKEAYSEIERRTGTYTTVSGSPILSVSNTESIEVGNRVFGTGIAADTVVNDIVYNSFVLLSNNMTANGSNTITFIDHRGFVKNVTGSTSGTTLTVSSGNTTNLRTNMILICNGVSALTGITTTGSSSQVTIFPSQNLNSREMYFYQDRGLVNDSLSAFCTPVETVCLIVSADVNAGNTTIGVDNNSDLGSGTYSVLGSQFAANTTITGTPGNNITINNATTAKLLEGEKVTATRESSDVNQRVLCCPPLDTSPPFTPTEEGLETKSIRPSMKVDNGNIKFDTLTATGISTITALSSGLTETVSGRVSIDTPSGTFKLLCE